MGLLLMVVTFVACGLCLAEDKAARRRFMSGVLALLYLPELRSWLLLLALMQPWLPAPAPTAASSSVMFVS